MHLDFKVLSYKNVKKFMYMYLKFFYNDRACFVPIEVMIFCAKQVCP